MLEGEPGTLESREELTLPGEVRGCWGEQKAAEWACAWVRGRGRGSALGLGARRAARRAATRRRPRLPGRPHPPPARRERAPHLLQSFHAVGGGGGARGARRARVRRGLAPAARAWHGPGASSSLGDSAGAGRLQGGAGAGPGCGKAGSPRAARPAAPRSEPLFSGSGGNDGRGHPAARCKRPLHGGHTCGGHTSRLLHSASFPQEVIHLPSRGHLGTSLLSAGAEHRVELATPLVLCGLLVTL